MPTLGAARRRASGPATSGRRSSPGAAPWEDAGPSSHSGGRAWPTHASWLACAPPQAVPAAHVSSRLPDAICFIFLRPTSDCQLYNTSCICTPSSFLALSVVLVCSAAHAAALLLLSSLCSRDATSRVAALHLSPGCHTARVQHTCHVLQVQLQPHGYCESPATTMKGRIWCWVTSPFCTYGSAATNASMSSLLTLLRQVEGRGGDNQLPAGMWPQGSNRCLWGAPTTQPSARGGTVHHAHNVQVLLQQACSGLHPAAAPPAPEDEERAVHRLRQRSRHHQLVRLRLRKGWRMEVVEWGVQSCQSTRLSSVNRRPQHASGGSRLCT